MNSQRSFGVVVVRYTAQGCNVELEVLANCIARGQKYSYQPYWSNESKYAQTQDDLYASLPIGAASLQGHIKDGQSTTRNVRSVTLSMSIVNRDAEATAAAAAPPPSGRDARA